MKRKFLPVLTVFLLFVSLCANTLAKESEPALKVFLEEKSAVEIVLNGQFGIYDVDAKDLLKKAKSGQKVSVRIEKGKVLLDNKPIKGNNLELMTLDKNSFFTLGGKKYRGSALLKSVQGKLRVINVVDLESYVKGVVPFEMSESWEAEALKAQSVAARTFALYTQGEKKHEGYDVCATTHCQVYGGMSGEAASVNAAVEATRGEVLFYRGKVIYAAFHSDSGGYTAGSEEVWGGELPYLRSVKDETVSKNTAWTKELTLTDAEAVLKESGYAVGRIKKITLTPLKLGAGKTSDRSQSGRVQQVNFHGNKGMVSLTGLTMRKVFKLKSTLFDLRFASEKNSGKEHKPAKSDDKLIFEGRGSGHGLGMSQWGAKLRSAKTDYRKILQYYYTNVELKKLY